jgi:hypothetical protein
MRPKKRQQSRKPKGKAFAKGEGKGSGQTKHQPLDTKQAAFLKDYHYNKSGYTGRDVLYKQLQVYYEKSDTPKEERTYSSPCNFRLNATSL